MIAYIPSNPLEIEILANEYAFGPTSMELICKS
jgi:hypothetical protein